MRSKFDEQLSSLNEKLILMGQAIEKNIQDAIDALVNGNTEKANQIIKQDDEIDKMQREIENICFGLLIQQQPVARDLRLITAAMKMVTDMERIGDHAVDISEMTEFLSVREMNDKFETLKLMASEATVMLIHSIDAFTEKSAEVAKDVIDHDDIVDDLFLKVKTEKFNYKSLDKTKFLVFEDIVPDFIFSLNKLKDPKAFFELIGIIISVISFS